MKMMNFETKELLMFLSNQVLAGKRSRMRTRFCKILAEKIKQAEDECDELIAQYALVDSAGSPITDVDDQGRNVYKLRDREQFNREFDVLMREEIVIAKNEENAEMYDEIVDIVLNTSESFRGEAAFKYDRLCEIVES